MMTLNEIINRAVKEAINKWVAKKQKLVEYRQVNKKDTGRVPFPGNKYEINVYPSEHNPPHFHIISSDGWDISFNISDGEIYQVNHEGTNPTTYNYMEKKAPKWLLQRSTFIKNMTNQQVVQQLWTNYQEKNQPL